MNNIFNRGIKVLSYLQGFWSHWADQTSKWIFSCEVSCFFPIDTFYPARAFLFWYRFSHDGRPFHLALDQPQASYQHAIMTHVLSRRLQPLDQKQSINPVAHSQQLVFFFPKENIYRSRAFNTANLWIPVWCCSSHPPSKYLGDTPYWPFLKFRDKPSRKTKTNSLQYRNATRTSLYINQPKCSSEIISKNSHY